MKYFLRTYCAYDLDEVRQHLLIVGDVSGDCAACRELGIDPMSAKECPRCKTPFRYLASRRLETHPSERFSFAKKMAEARPDLILIDYQDYQRATGTKTARDFFA